MTEANFLPARLGVVLNPLSGRIRRRRVEVQRCLDALPSADVREVSTVSGIDAALQSFAAEQVDLLVVVGGDGTVQMVLTCLFESKPFAALPVLAVIPAGTTNMTALDLGVHGSPIRALRRLRHWLQTPVAPRLVKRRAVHIRQSGCPDIYGMFFGAGVITGGVRYSQNRKKKSGMTGELATGVAVLRFLFDMLIGRTSPIITPVQIRLLGRDGDGQDRSCLFLLGSTLERLLLGMRPYWGEEDAPLHVTWVSESPTRFWRSLPLLVAGRGKRITAHDDYYSSNVRVLEVIMDDHFIVDGEQHLAESRNGPLRLETTEPVTFLVP